MVLSMSQMRPAAWGWIGALYAVTFASIRLMKVKKQGLERETFVMASAGRGIVSRVYDHKRLRRMQLEEFGGRKEVWMTPHELNELEREARAAIELEHRNIVALREVYRDEPWLCLLFDWAEGRTVEERIKDEGALSPNDCLPILRALCDALDHAHGKGVVHRHLTPRHLVLDKEGLRILEFGGVPRRGFLGHQDWDRWNRYRAPEARDRLFSRESDLFSAGMCLYEMLTGTVPQADPASFPPPGYGNFFMRALSPSPEERFHSGAELLAAFERAASPSR
jgi:serine/threonine protein kinase